MKKNLIAHRANPHALYGITLSGTVVESGDDSFIVLLQDAKDLTRQKPAPLRLEFVVSRAGFPVELGDNLVCRVSCRPEAIFIEATDAA